MKNQVCISIIAFIAIISLVSFTKNNHPANQLADTTLTIRPLVEKVLTKEEQQAFTPDMVIQSLKEGNKRFMSNSLTARDHSMLVRDAALGQYPKAVILSCLDSRVPVEDIFDKGIGDLFIGRVAGNFANTDLVGSMEYGCKVSGAKLILVMGHQSCGAIKSAIDHVKLGNITSMLHHIDPAIYASKDFKAKKSSKNKEYVDFVAINNVKTTIKEIKTLSPILKAMEKQGQIKIIGAYYNLHTGEVEFL
jgi:carbonic anhydrase